MEISRLKICNGDLVLIEGSRWNTPNIKNVLNSWAHKNRLNLTIETLENSKDDVKVTVISGVSIDEIFEKEVLK